MTTPQNKETKEKQTFFVVIGKTAQKKSNVMSTIFSTMAKTNSSDNFIQQQQN